MAGIMTLAMVLQEFYHISLTYYGIYPRHTEGLWGIVLLPSCMQAGVIISLISFPSLLCCL